MNKQNKVSVVSAVALVVLIGGVALAYPSYFKSPQKVVTSMMQKMSDVKSFTHKGEINMEMPESKQPGLPRSLVLKFGGSSDVSNLDQPKGLFSFTLDSYAAGAAPINLEGRIVSKMIYLKVTGVPNLGFFNPKSLEDQWILIDQDALKKQFGVPATDPQSLNTEQKEQIKQAVLSSNVLKVAKALPAEDIDGVSTYHYQLTLDKDALVKLISKSNLILQNKNWGAQQEQQFKDSLKTMGTFGGEVWIGKSDLLVRKATLEMLPMPDQQTGQKVNISVAFTDFNQPVVVEAPSKFKTIQEVLGPVFGALKSAH